MSSGFFAATGIPYDGNSVARGSAFRGGRSLVGIGASDASIAAGATEDITFTIREPGVLGRLFIQGVAAEIEEMSVTSIKLNNDELLSGAVPAQMFAANAVGSPGFGHLVKVNDQLTVSIYNSDGTNASGDVFLGFSVG